MQIRPLGISDYDDVYRLWLATPDMGLNDVDDSRNGNAFWERMGFVERPDINYRNRSLVKTQRIDT